MLKKFFVGLFCAMCLGVFAEVKLTEFYFRKVDATDIQKMKEVLKQGKTKEVHIIAGAIAIFCLENQGKEITLEQMEQVAKQYAETENKAYGAILRYLQRNNLINKYSNKIIGNNKYVHDLLYKYLVGYNFIKTNNNFELRMEYIATINDVEKKLHLFNSAVNLTLKECENESDENAIKMLKKMYRFFLPKVGENALFKPIATKIGLALRSYGVDVK